MRIRYFALLAIAALFVRWARLSNGGASAQCLLRTGGIRNCGANGIADARAYFYVNVHQRNDWRSYLQSTHRIVGWKCYLRRVYRFQREHQSAISCGLDRDSGIFVQRERCWRHSPSPPTHRAGR